MKRVCFANPIFIFLNLYCVLCIYVFRYLYTIVLFSQMKPIVFRDINCFIISLYNFMKIGDGNILQLFKSEHYNINDILYVKKEKNNY